ncbi:DHH family phosphoesterase [Eubacteriales bacterium OttesenSCG-928-K08]|nr:DHH family phosphoesterase [Eubacteriales bacterium OttesenSCG-928-K08]
MKKSPQGIFVPIAILCAALCAGLLYYSKLSAALGAGLSLIIILLCALVLRRHIREQDKQMNAAVIDNASAAGRLIAAVGVPCMIFHTDGRIIWRNNAMKKLYDSPTIKNLPAACQPKSAHQSMMMEYSGGAYQVVVIPVERERDAGRPLLFQYWLDRTEAEHYSRLYEEHMPYVALVYVDNYEELKSDLQYQRNTVLGEVERLIAETVSQIDGIYRRYDNGRFLLVFEAQHLARLEKERFSLLERVHKIETGSEQTVTLSIAIGAASRIAQADTDARNAMELALGRGGDQAVVKNGTNYSFYGGRKQLDASQSRVRTRLFAKALRQLIENSTEVFVMGHKQPDMDCIGAAMGLVRCSMQANRKPHIVLDQVNPTIQKAIDEIRANQTYAGILLSPESVKSMIRPSSVLIVVDTQRASTVIAPELLKSAGKLVLIDHHRRSADYIDNATLNYLESRASSSCEMVTEIMQYFQEGLRPTAFECSTLLAGITVDTKHFSFNVGARTFEAAAYLRQHGADISMVKLMFQDDRQTYADRVDTVRSATMLTKGIAISYCAPGVQNAALIAAQAADALISIRGIQAAFVLAATDSGISISGRSLGSVNTQMILESLGGGGHLTMAGAQLKDISMDEALAITKEAVLNYMNDYNENTRGAE